VGRIILFVFRNFYRRFGRALQNEMAYNPIRTRMKVNKLSGKFKTRLVARNEGIDYIDDSGIYHFNVCLKDNQWDLQIPGTKGNQFEPYELTDEEQKRILPRITKYLENVKWFALFRKPYGVKITRT
jgi:hypothetical protein